MKGFIELRAIGGHKVFFPIERIAFGNSNIGTIIFFNSSTYGVEETIEEIEAKIEEASEQKSEPRQNIYYRTEDRLPTEEDAGGAKKVLVTNNGITWMSEYVGNAKLYDFWAPCPKVEVIV